jgi:hypothetical protein
MSNWGKVGVVWFLLCVSILTGCFVGLVPVFRSLAESLKVIADSMGSH